MMLMMENNGTLPGDEISLDALRDGSFWIVVLGVLGVGLGPCFEKYEIYRIRFPKNPGYSYTTEESCSKFLKKIFFVNLGYARQIYIFFETLV